MKLCMIGTGYVGLVSGVCFSDLGNDVICVDKDENKINSLKRGKVPIYEPGLSELVVKNFRNKRLSFSNNLKESVKNSGFETIENLFLLFFFDIIFSISSPVVTGTVDFVIIILNLFIDELNSFATLKIWLKSAELPFFFVGVPTQIKIISLFLTDVFKSDEKDNLLFL